jgi:hypothetical protein
MSGQKWENRKIGAMLSAAASNLTVKGEYKKHGRP